MALVADGNANTQIGQCVPSIAMEFLADNPCDRLGPVLGLPPHLVQHREAFALSRRAGSHHDGVGLGFRVYNGSIRGRQNGNPGEKPSNGRIAVKVINHLGDEVMKVFRVNR